MDRSRKANRKGNERTLQHKSPQNAMLIEQLAAENLAALQSSIEQSKQHAAGAAAMQQRIKTFGACHRIEGETASQFYERLRLWFEREISPTKSPLHPPRQSGEVE